jgi:hypothetical protein
MSGGGLAPIGGGSDFSGDVSIGGDIYLTGGGAVKTTANGDLQLLPDGSGFTKVGDAGSPNRLGSTTNDDLYVSGKLEVDGYTWFDYDVKFNRFVYFNSNWIYIYNSRALGFGTLAYASISYENNQGATSAGWVFGVPDASPNNQRILLITDKADRNKNYLHNPEPNPTIIIHSNTTAATATNEWVSFAHNTTDAEIMTGKGGILFAAPTSAPTVNKNSQLTWHLDETTNDIVFTVKYSGGAVKTGTVALT